MIFKPEPEIWLQDFLIANLIEIIKKKSNGIITFRSFDEENPGLYEQFIQLLCKKFSRNEDEIQLILKELNEFVQSLPSPEECK